MSAPLTTYASRQQAQTDRYARQLQRRYNQALEQLVRLAVQENKPGGSDELFSFARQPRLARQTQILLAEYERGLGSLVRTGTRVAWAESEAKNKDQFGALTPLEAGKLTNARGAFERRVINGRTTADRVQARTAQFRAELELAIDQALAQSKGQASATEIIRRVRVSLQNPDRLFAQVRARRGEAALRAAPLAYRPGAGTYRSSYRNATRLLRTEMQQAYREADYQRWQQEPTVVGVEVRRSALPSACPVCGALAGLYPKAFRFLGWHPQCRCVAVPVLDTPVETLPANYTGWVAQNRSRWEERSGKMPQFIRLNAE